eukprot:g1387.t1
MLEWRSLRGIRRILPGVVACFLVSGVEAVPCQSTSEESEVSLVVDSQEAVIEVIQTVNCTGGVFAVEWVGNVVLPSVLYISGGTVLRIYGNNGGDTIESLAFGDSVVDGAFSTQLFSVSSAELHLEGMTITGGYSGIGGAISAVDSVVTMTDCVATGNVADVDGGAVSLQRSRLDVLGVTSFANNSARHTGGAIRATGNSSITVDGDGEAIYSNNSVPLLLNENHGGAISLWSSSNLTILGKATFHGNVGGNGGAVSSWDGSFVNATGEVEFEGNEGAYGGAISFYSYDDYITAMNLGGRANFLNNSATVDGGVLHVWDGGDLSISGEVDFARNRAAGEGGAMVMSGAGRLNIEDGAIVRYTKNECGGNGGGLALWDGGGFRASSEGVAVSFNENSAGGSGGAIFAQGVESFSFGGGADGNVSFTGNKAVSSGGAVCVLVAAAFYVGGGGVEFRGNTAMFGGAVVVDSSEDVASLNEGGLTSVPASMSECSFFGNRAQEDGGAVHVGSGFIDLFDCVFEGNNAGRSGGALSISGEVNLLFNDKFYENSAPSGPAVMNMGIIDVDVDSDQAPTPTALEFADNSLICGDGHFVDYTDPVLETTAAADANVSAKRYMVDCDGCPTWWSCTNCSVLGDVREHFCAPILDHTTSDQETGTLETLKLDPGYWRATDTSKRILSCFNEDACEGGAVVGSYCAAGYEGPYCSVCEEGYAPGRSFTCNRCSDEGSSIAIAVVVVVVIAMVVVGILLYVTGVAAPSCSTSHLGWREKLDRLKDHFPSQSTKILVVSWQIISQFAHVTSTVFPESYERFLAIVGVTNLDLGRLLSAGCLVSVDYHGRLLLSTLGPMVVALVLACTYVVATRRNGGADDEGKASIKNKLASIMLLVAFLVYGSVSATVFGMFVCEDLDDEGSYLRGDYSIRCDTDKHRSLQGYSVLMILIYPVGIPAFFAWLLISHRGDLLETNRDKSPTIAPFADLWQPYLPNMYLYELLEYLRRILMTGLVVFIFPETAAQISVTFVIGSFFFVVSIFLRPYREREVSWLSHVGHVVVLASLYLALLLKVDISDETDESQEIFAGVLITIHCLMILAIFAEAILVVFAEAKSLMDEGEDHLDRSTPLEIKYPLRRAVSTSSRKTNEDKSADE